MSEDFKMSAPSHVVANNYNYGSDPIIVTCFNCKNTAVTSTTESTNAFCACMFGCWSLCCPGCQDVQHNCSHCNVVLGTYKPR